MARFAPSDLDLHNLPKILTTDKSVSRQQWINIMPATSHRQKIKCLKQGIQKEMSKKIIIIKVKGIMQICHCGKDRM